MPALSLDLEIDYENGSTTSRHITVYEYGFIEGGGEVILNAYCHLRRGDRSFNSKKIRRCVNLADSTLIPSLPAYIKGIEEQNKKPMGRSQERYQLAKKFRPEVLYYQFKRKFFFLFDDQCFKCGRPAEWRCIPETDLEMGGVLIQEQLVMDHHIPFEKGGKLEAGNTVCLCKQCNGAKGTSHPERFYSGHELDPKGRWYWTVNEWRLFLNGDNETRREILLGEGVNEELARCCLDSPDHRFFCGNSANDSSLALSIRIQLSSPREIKEELENLD
jgi:5-methylcytosine-specific restriction endonuclease McrA